MKRRSILCLLLAALLCLFAACGLAATLTLPAGLKVIGEEAFWGDSSLDEVVLPEGLERIESRAFAGSSVSLINLPDSIDYIDDDAFDGCDNLYVTVNQNSYAHSWIQGEGLPIMPEVLSADNFEYTSSTNGITITEYIGDYDADVVIPKEINGKKVIAIADDAFSTCFFVPSIWIPSTVESIGTAVFSYCYDLKSVNVYGNNPVYYSIDGILFGKKQNSIEYYPAGKADNEVYVIPRGIQKIGHEAFISNQHLKEIKLPNSINTIDERAFCNCEKLTRIEIPNGITEIADDVFTACSSLTNIVLPDSITRIGAYAFSGCESLTNIELPDSIKTIGDCAFNCCTSLEVIRIPESVASIGFDTFNACSNLMNVYIPATVTKIHQMAFNGCNEDLRIYGKAKSYAETYAKKYGIQFKAVNSPAEMPTPAPTPTATPTATPTVAPTATPTPKIAHPVLVHPSLSDDEDRLPAFTDDDMTLVWGNVENAVKYTVRMDESYNDGWDKLITEEETTEETYVIPGREFYDGGLFRVRITAYDVNGETNTSDWYYFRVGAASYIGLDDEEILFDYEENRDRFNIYTSENWKANVSDRSWIDLDMTSGFATTYLTVEVPENSGDFPRIGTITFTNDAGGYAVLTITQEGNGSANTGNLRIANPGQGDTLPYEDISAEWSYRYDHAYYEAKLYDATSGRTVYQEQMTSDYADISESVLTYGHVYQFTVSVYNEQRKKINESSVVFRIENSGTGGNTDPDDEVIETPEVPEGKTEIVYSGIEPQMDKKDISISWDKVIGADYYAVALRDLTLCPDGTPDTDVQKVIDTTTQNLNYQISSNKLEQGHSYRLWIAAHKNGITNAITGKNILFTINEPEATDWYANVTDATSNDLTKSGIQLDYTGIDAKTIYVRTNNGDMTAWCDADFPFTLTPPTVELQADGTYLFTYQLSAQEDTSGMVQEGVLYFCLRDENGQVITDSPLAQVRIAQGANHTLPVVFSVVDSAGNDLTKTPLTIDYTGACATSVIVHANRESITAWFNSSNAINFGAPVTTMQEDGTYLLTYNNITATENATANEIVSTCTFYAYETDAAQPDKSKALAEVQVVRGANPYLAIVKSVSLKNSLNADEVYNLENCLDMEVGYHNTDSGFVLDVVMDERYKEAVFGDAEPVWYIYTDAPDIVDVYRKAENNLYYVHALKEGNTSIYISHVYANAIDEIDPAYVHEVCDTQVNKYRYRAIIFGTNVGLLSDDGTDAGIQFVGDLREKFLMNTYSGKTVDIMSSTSGNKRKLLSMIDDAANSGKETDLTYICIIAHGYNPKEHAAGIALWDGGFNTEGVPTTEFLAYSEMFEHIARIPGKIVFITASCYSGSAIEFAEPYGNKITVLAASSASKTSAYYDVGALFIAWIMDGRDINEDGVVTVKEAFDYAKVGTDLINIRAHWDEIIKKIKWSTIFSWGTNVEITPEDLLLQDPQFYGDEDLPLWGIMP